jgi:hypothetical protein
MPGNPPPPWLPTTISCARFDASRDRESGTDSPPAVAIVATHVSHSYLRKQQARD